MTDGTVMDLPLMEDYDAVAPGLAGAGVEWLDKIRSDGLARYGKLGLPGPRDEAWKYTNLTRMGRTKFVPAMKAEKPSLDKVPKGALDVDAPKLVLVNPIGLQAVWHGDATSQSTVCLVFSGFLNHVFC